jgi:hypothetical protein
MSSAARAPSVEELMGYHLQADVAHDFGADAPVYNIGGAGAAARVGAPNTTEDGALNYFIGPSPRGLPNVTKDLVARLGQQVIFTIPDKTASFQNWKAPVLFQGGNDKIGVVQDAGEFITQRIGAKNVITFGSILDPAGKPIAPDQEPIWFQPPTNEVTIPLNIFGFAPASVGAIRIKDLTAGTVKAGYMVSGSEDPLDAVGMKQIKNLKDGKPKPINQTDVGKAGFFTSIKKAGNVGRELVTSGVVASTSQASTFVSRYAQYFFIGKTLGDAMLVASAMPGFPGNIPNPYYGIGAATGWKSWVFNDRTVASPSLLCLKTGDRLNWLRAVLLNVPAIYEDQAKGGRKIKQYKFIPGLADPAAIKAAILSDFDTLIPSIAERYTSLQASLGTLLDGTKINRAKTNFAPGGSKEISSENAAILAGRLVGEIRTRLGAISKRVTDWVAKQKTVASAIPATNTEQLRKVYQTTLDRANACAPQTSTIFIEKGKQEPYLSSKLIVANVPAGVKQGEWPLTTSIDIALRNAFSNINRARVVDDATYAEKIANTDIQNRFFAKVNAMKLGARRGGGPEDLLIEEADDGAPLIEEEPVDEPIADVPLDTVSIETEVLEVVGSTLEQTKGIDVDDPTIPVQTGGGFLTPSLLRDDVTEWPIILQSFPRTADFLSYLASKGINTLKGIVLIYDIIRRRTTNRIVDPYLLEELVQEFSLLLGYKKTGEPEPPATPYIAIQGADLSVFSTDYMIPQTTPSSTATVMFDAYTYFVNARNASEFGTEEIVTQSVRDYEMYEQKYLALLGTMQTRSGQQLLPAASTVRLGPKEAASLSVQKPEERRKESLKKSEAARDAEMERRRRGALQEGGLRDRRPLYAKNVRSSGTLGDDNGGDNQGLRKRSRARATPRVRKHSRGSKTRRQRKYVDRV